MARPSPIPCLDRFMWDETGSPSLSGDPTDDEWEAHDPGCRSPASTRDILFPSLWATSRASSMCANFSATCKGTRARSFPILLKKVVYDGTHTGDWIPVKESPALLREVDLVLGSSDILTEGEKEFFDSMKRLCEASIATGNPILF